MPTNIYEALVLIEGCLVTAPLDIGPGLGIWPISDDRHRLGIAAVMDGIVAGAGWDLGTSWSEWLARDRANLPLALIQHTLPASSLPEALVFSGAFVDAIIGALALRRGAAATPLVRVIREPADDIGEHHFVVEPGSPTYRGNLLGGALSGEGLGELRRLIEGAGDPLVLLWLGARRDIANERNPEFEVHRWWNLLEAIANEDQAAPRDVIDFDGTPIPHPQNGRPFRTSAKLGLVYMHIRDAFVEHSISPAAFVGHSDTLWDLIVAWYGFRNAVAHHGTFDARDPALRRWYWFEQTKRAHEWNQQPGNEFLLEIVQLGDRVVEWAIEKRHARRLNHDDE